MSLRGMTVTTLFADRAVSARPTVRAAFWRALRRWAHNRRSRIAMSYLDERLLRDVGLHEVAQRHLHRPFRF